MAVPGVLLGIFTNDERVIHAGIGALAIVGLGQPAQAVIFTLGGALRGAGDTRFPLIAKIDRMRVTSMLHEPPRIVRSARPRHNRASVSAQMSALSPMIA